MNRSILMLALVAALGLSACERQPTVVTDPAAPAEPGPASLQTRGSLLAMNVDIDKIQKGKDDGDTGILDKRGRFVARRFEKVFGARSTVDRNGDKAFTATELTKMINANGETLAGYVAATAGWQLLLARGPTPSPSRVARRCRP